MSSESGAKRWPIFSGIVLFLVCLVLGLIEKATGVIGALNLPYFVVLGFLVVSLGAAVAGLLRLRSVTVPRYVAVVTATFNVLWILQAGIAVLFLFAWSGT